MAVPRPGEFITAKCSRCNDVTGHVVMLVLEGHVAKVECKACGSVHKYRESRLPAAAGASRSSVRHVRAGQERGQGREIGAGAPRKNSPAAKLESAWQEAMVRHSGRLPVAYAMGAAYALRDFLEHPVFGRGEVIAVAPGKMDVLFQEGVKLLRCGN
jgi:Zn ribbon nucleic-acid-binding protein